MRVALFTRAWIEIEHQQEYEKLIKVALFTRAWIEIADGLAVRVVYGSPSSRGRGLKFCEISIYLVNITVALFTRAWIEIVLHPTHKYAYAVALFTRAWIEIRPKT